MRKSATRVEMKKILKQFLRLQESVMGIKEKKNKDLFQYSDKVTDIILKQRLNICLYKKS